LLLLHACELLSSLHKDRMKVVLVVVLQIRSLKVAAVRHHEIPFVQDLLVYQDVTGVP